MAKLVKNTIRRPPLTKEETLKALNDFGYFCERCLSIYDKNGKIVPLRLNKAQTIFANLLLKYVFAPRPKPITLVILKARQMGYTTVLLALELYILIKFNNKEYASLNMKHFLHLGSIVEEITSDKMLPMIEMLHPTFFGEFQFNKSERKIRCIGFKGQKRNNTVRYHTAMSGESGRGGTAQAIILDEVAFYRNVGIIEKGAVSSVPNNGLSMLVYVSTANGINEFYDRVVEAQNNPEMEFLFLPWFLMEEYIAKPSPNFKETLTKYEQDILKEMDKWEIPEHLRLPKLAWYRNHLITKKGNDLSAMRQEFPSNWQEPFVSSDSPVFSTSLLLEEMKKEKIEPIGYATYTPEGKIVNGNEWDIAIYSKPVLGRKYEMVIDPAFGGEEADNTSVRVLDKITLEDQAVYVSKNEPEDIAEMAYALGKYYNTARINVENNRGELLITLLRNRGYSNFYFDAKRYNRNNPYKAVGTKMTVSSKAKGIERLKSLMNLGKYMPKDEETLQELLHFNYVGKGASRKAQACGNKPDGTPYHDDLVMGLVNWALTLPDNLFKNIEK